MKVSPSPNDTLLSLGLSSTTQPPHPEAAWWLLRTAWLASCGLAWFGSTLALPGLVSALATLVALGGGLLLVLELSANLVFLAHTRWQRSRSPLNFWRVRVARPAPGQVPPEPTTLLAGLHAALDDPLLRLSNAFVGLQIVGLPQQPVELGFSIGAIGAAAPRLSERLQRACTSLVRGLAPSTIVEACADPVAAALDDKTRLYWQDLALALPAHLPLAEVSSVADSLGVLAASLRPPAGVRLALLQCTVQALAENGQTVWRLHARRRLVRLLRMAGGAGAAAAQALRLRLEEPSLSLSVRVLVVAELGSEIAAKHVLRNVTNALKQYRRESESVPQHLRALGWPQQCQTPTAQHLRWLQSPRPTPLRPLLLPSVLWRPPALVGPSQAAVYWHLPSASVAEHFAWLPNRRLPVPAEAFLSASTPDPIILGDGIHDSGTWQPVGLGLRDLRRVLHITAGMGAGKSRLLTNIAQQCLPHGLLLLDGKGDDQSGNLAAAVRRLLTPADEDRLVLIDLLDRDWPIGLNPFAEVDRATPGGLTRSLGAILGLLARLDDGWDSSPGMQEYCRMATLLVLTSEPEPSLAHLKAALEQADYRARLLESCPDHEVVHFWRITFAEASDQQRSSVLALVRRLNNLLADETMRLILTQPSGNLDLLAAIEQRRLVIAPLPHIALGGLASFAGMLLMQAIVRAAFRRPGDDHSRQTIPLIVDELQVFLSERGSPDLQIAITQLRAYGIGGIYAHQSLAQLGPLRDEMLINAANRVILRTGEPDASAYALRFPQTGLTASDISGQVADEHQYAILDRGGRGGQPCSIRPLPWPTPPPPLTEKSVAWQRRLPPAEPAVRALDRQIVDLVYNSGDCERYARELAALPSPDWTLLFARWQVISTYQRAYLLAHPTAVAAESGLEASFARQRWLSRLRYARPRLLALAEYWRNRHLPHT